MKMNKTGWFNESKRHSLASKGIKSAQKIPMCEQKHEGWYLNTPMTYTQYLSVMSAIKKEFGSKWDKLPDKTKKVFIQNHLKKKFPKTQLKF